MQILKSKEERGHEVNQFASHIGNPVVRDLDKIVRNNKAYREAAKSLNTKEWIDEDGNIHLDYNSYLDSGAEKFMHRYPQNFARDIKPELVILKKDQDGKILIHWNVEAVKILWRDNKSYEFKKEMDNAILKWSNYEYEKELDMKDRWKYLESLLDSFEEQINNLQG